MLLALPPLHSCLAYYPALRTHTNVPFVTPLAVSDRCALEGTSTVPSTGA